MSSRAMATHCRQFEPEHRAALRRLASEQP
jgi:hypothetical protein